MRANQCIATPFCLALAALLFAGCAAQSSQPPVPPLVIDGTAGGETAALKAELDERNREVEDLKAEIDHLRLREEDLTERLKVALRRSPGKTLSDTPLETAGAPSSDETIKQLQERLRGERAKRQQLETQLAQLRVETSSPPIPEARLIQPPSEVAKRSPDTTVPPPLVPLEVVDLTEEEPEEPAAAPPPIEVASLPPPAPKPPSPLNQLQEGDVAALRTRGIEQETRHQEAIASLARVLDADRRRQEGLEAQIAALNSGAPGTAGALAADSNELAHLRGRLEEERRRNAELMAKLKLAGRVTDLVFRMQQQPAPAAQAAPAYPRYSQEDLFGNPNAPDQPYTDDEGNVHQPIEPEVPDARGPRGVEESGEVEAPAVEQPGVFDRQGTEGEIVDEVTQD